MRTSATSRNSPGSSPRPHSTPACDARIGLPPTIRTLDSCAPRKRPREELRYGRTVRIRLLFAPILDWNFDPIGDRRDVLVVDVNSEGSFKEWKLRLVRSAGEGEPP